MDECVPADREFDESANHADLLVDASHYSRIEVDGSSFSVMEGSTSRANRRPKPTVVADTS